MKTAINYLTDFTEVNLCNLSCFATGPLTISSCNIVQEKRLSLDEKSEKKQSRFKLSIPYKTNPKTIS